MEQAKLKDKPSLTLSRSYPVSPEKVWRAWTDPQALTQWFRPGASFSVPLVETDVRAGGRFRILMIDEKGEEFDLAGVYREVVPDRKLVMTWGWKSQPGQESLVTVIFRPSGTGTEVELRHEGFVDFDDQPTHEQGWSGALDQLARLLAGRPSLALRREYPVAPEKVWRAWTDPEALKEWWGPGGNDPVSLAQLDVRVGGRFRIVFGGPQGRDHEVQGVYREVVPNRKLVFTWTWPNSTPERESLVTILFKQVASGTELVFLHEGHYDETVRDGHKQGWSESFVKLERFLKGEMQT